MKSLEEAARSRSEADWLVGMNATRAASIRLRAAFDGAVSLGRVQTPTLALVARREEEIRNFVPEPYWLVEARFEATGERRYTGRYLGGKRLPSEDEAKAIVDAVTGPGRRDHEAREEGGARAAAAPLRPHEPPAPREQPVRLLGAPHARGRAAALRGAQGAHLPAYQLALPDGRHGPRDQADGRARRAQPAATRRGARSSSTSTRCLWAAWSTTRRSPTTTRSSRRTPSTTSRRWAQDELKVYDLVTKRFLASSIRRRSSSARAWRRRCARTCSAPAGGASIEAGWRSVYGELSEQDRAGR